MRLLDDWLTGSLPCQLPCRNATPHTSLSVYEDSLPLSVERREAKAARCKAQGGGSLALFSTYIHVFLSRTASRDLGAHGGRLDATRPSAYGVRSNSVRQIRRQKLVREPLELQTWMSQTQVTQRPPARRPPTAPCRHCNFN